MALGAAGRVGECWGGGMVVVGGGDPIIFLQFGSLDVVMASNPEVP